ncbi:MAG: restriction endonuclease subunit S [Desulfurivibrio sp.]|nr:restriction endonuclease subunit S [Desulfurivibrio sp.]
MEKELPDGWTRAPLGDVLEKIVGGGTPSKGVPEYFQGSIPLMTVKDMKDARPSKTGFNITEEALANSSSRIVPADTIIIATRMGLGKVARPVMPTAINQDLKALFPTEALEKSFLEQWLISIASNIEAMGTGTTVKGVRLNQIRDLEVPLPPLNEQRRIVEKIETLFARLNKGEAALREVQKLLARYRQSVLKAAVTGQLTADWRAENAHCLEPGRDLLTRILQTRRETWQSRGKYQEPAIPDTTDLPELPVGWVWASLDALIIDGPTNGLSPKESSSGKGVPSFKLTATTSGSFVINEKTIKYVGVEVGADSKYWLRTGDVLVQRGNTIEYVGTAAIYPGPNDTYIYPDLMMRIRFADPLIAQWAVTWINFEFAKKHFRRLATGTAGNMPKINSATLKSLAVPLPAQAEVQKILEEVRTVHQRCELSLEASQTELIRSASLRHSILKDAFAGRLVPQDPNDEPAADLLARIRTTRDTAPNKTTRKKANP